MNRQPPVHLRRRAALLACALLPCTAGAADADALQSRPWPAKKATPALLLPRWEGQSWSLAAARGLPVLLNFWASWCEPCRAELPSLELLATRHEPQGLQVLTVNFRETDGAVRRFVEATAMSLPVLRDRDGAAAQAFGVRTFPSTVAINRQGRVLSTVIGEVDWNSPAARRWVAQLL
jgi:thiol-disulfide isomerase/thioredoxin